MFPETLDPRDWEEFRALAHGLLDRALDWQRDARDVAAWRPMPADVERRFRTAVPIEGAGAAADDGAGAARLDQRGSQ